MANVHKDVLDGFWKLGEDKDNVRIDAAIKIVDHAKQCDEEAKKYILGRLVKGLASNRASARQGFFVALVEVLKQSNDDSDIVEKLKALMDEHLKHKGSKSEEGEFLCGQLFCLGALLRSDRVSGDAAAETVKGILDLAKKRSYLTIAGYGFLVDYINRIDSETFTKKIWPVIRDGHDWKTSENWSLETLWMLLTMHQSHPKALDKAFLLENFGRKNLVTEELGATAAKCGDVSIPIHLLRKHPVNTLLVRCLRQENLLEAFWVKHVDPNLAASSYKTMAAFSLLELIVEEENKESHKYLTRNVVEAALTHLSKLESTDDQAVFGLLAKFVKGAGEDAEAQKKLLKALLTHSGGGNVAFDKLTGGNVVQQLVSGCNNPEVVMFAGKLYRSAAAGGDAGGKKMTAQERVFACHQLAKLVPHRCLQEEEEWRVNTLNFLLSCSLFETTPPLSREARGEVRETFFRALDFKARNFEQVCGILMRVAKHADGLLISRSAVPLNPFGEKAKAAWKQMLKDVEGIETKTAKKKEDSVFQLLFLHMGFQLFLNWEIACESLADLRQCHQRASSVKKTVKKTRKSKGAAEEEEEPLWVEVVVDLLLSLQSQNKHVLRQLANSVFSMICPHLTTDALQAVLDVVQPPKDAAKEEGDDSDAEEGEEEEEEEAQEEEDEEEEEEESDESEEEEEEEDQEDENVKELRNRVKSALGEHADSDQDSIDMDDISEEDMKKMDEALSNVFRQLSGKKGHAEKKKEQKDTLAMLHFRTRALDMVDIYLNHQPTVSHVVLVMETVMAALESAAKKKEEKPLETRLRNTLKKIANLKKPQQFRETDPELEPTMLVEALKALVEMASGGSPLMTLLNNPIPLFSQCCTLLLKMSQQLGDDKLSKEMDKVYDSALDDCFKKIHCMLPIAFFSLPMQGNWKGSWLLADKLVANAFDPEVRQFRRNQAVTLLSTLFHNNNLQEEHQEIRARVAKQLQIHLLSELRGEKGEAKPRYLCELLSLLHGLHFAKAAELDWPLLTEALTQFRDRVPKNRNFQDVKRAFNKIGVLLNVKVVQGSEKKEERKRLPSQSEANGDTEEKQQNGKLAEKGEKKKKKKKHNHNKDGLQQKKEAKLHAVEGQFAGMEMPSFSGVALTDNMNFETSKVEKEKESKKKEKKKKKKAENGH